MSITLMSYNTMSCLNYMTRELDYEAFAQVIRSHGADIIGLNEIHGKGGFEESKGQAEMLAEKLGYHCFFAKAIDLRDGDPYGNAILSRFPIIRAQVIPIPDPKEPAYDDYYETRCLLKAEIDVNGGMSVCVTHFGLNPDEQENALATVLENISDEKCVLMGDFNVTPDSPLLVPIRERMRDAAELFSRDWKSFPSDAPDRKLDYIFTSHDISVISAVIPGDIVSDHRPHIAIIE